jgi:20S proteasome subunit beta 7
VVAVVPVMAMAAVVAMVAMMPVVAAIMIMIVVVVMVMIVVMMVVMMIIVMVVMMMVIVMMIMVMIVMMVVVVMVVVVMVVMMIVVMVVVVMIVIVMVVVMMIMVMIIMVMMMVVVMMMVMPMIVRRGRGRSRRIVRIVGRHCGIAALHRALVIRVGGNAKRCAWRNRHALSGGRRGEHQQRCNGHAGHRREIQAGRATQGHIVHDAPRVMVNRNKSLAARLCASAPISTVGFSGYPRPARGRFRLATERSAPRDYVERGRLLGRRRATAGARGRRSRARCIEFEPAMRA